METLVKKRKSEAKKAITGMMPVKKWLTRDEACSYLSLSLNSFLKVDLQEQFTKSKILVDKVCYRVSELDSFLERNIFIKQPKQ